MNAAPFPDKAAPPAREAVLAALGTSRDRWIRLEDFARRTYGLDGEAIFFGADSGWCVRYRRSGRALFTLLPRDGGFGALVVVGPSAWVAAADAELSESTRAKWDAAHPYPDGRWLWLDVVDDVAVSDIERLVKLKSPPSKRRRDAH